MRLKGLDQKSSLRLFIEGVVYVGAAVLIASRGDILVGVLVGIAAGALLVAWKAWHVRRNQIG
jgi:ABC-type uncharacterized transport system permease subunit